MVHTHLSPPQGCLDNMVCPQSKCLSPDLIPGGRLGWAGRGEEDQVGSCLPSSVFL
jgi:hypothetical protein